MKILVSAYLDNNIGDDLMIKLLAKKFPSCSFYIASNNSAVHNTFRNYENIIFHTFSTNKEYLKQFKVHISIGGSLFNDMNNIKGIIYRIRRIMMLYKFKRNNMKLATIGCNLGPYKNKAGLILTKKELQLNNIVSVRDRESYNFIANFKSVRNFHLASDIVFNYANELKSDNYSTPTYLGISTYRSIQNSEYNFSSYTFLAAIADKYIEVTGNKVLLFAFDSEKENDLSSAHHIKTLSRYPDKIDIIAYLGCHETFIESMKQCEKFITIRFHSAVLSQILRIPFLPIVYSNKMDNYLDDESYLGIRIQFKDMKLHNYNIDDIVRSLISNENIFNDFTNDKADTSYHFNELSKIIFS